MRLIGHGIDIVEVSRVNRCLEEGDEFELAWFTSAERERAQDEPDRSAFLAGRVAAKEAVAKALGTGFWGDITQVDIEIRKREPGPPIVVLSGGALAMAQRLGIDRWMLSISHTSQHAVASAIALQEEG